MGDSKHFPTVISLSGMEAGDRQGDTGWQGVGMGLGGAAVRHTRAGRLESPAGALEE